MISCIHFCHGSVRNNESIAFHAPEINDRGRYPAVFHVAIKAYSYRIFGACIKAKVNPTVDDEDEFF